MEDFVVTITEREEDDYGEGGHWKLEAGNLGIGVGNLEPEDASLGRGLNFVYSIPSLLKLAHIAGIEGRALKIIKIKDE